MHALSYQLYPDVNVIIHTHQIFASRYPLRTFFPADCRICCRLLRTACLETPLPGIQLHKNIRLLWRKAGPGYFDGEHGIYPGFEYGKAVTGRLLEKFAGEIYGLTGKEPTGAAIFI